MKPSALSIRTFIGAQNFDESRAFYKDLGFEEHVISNNLSYFRIAENLGFYLQDYYVQDWINNAMVFLEVEDVQAHWEQLQQLDLPRKYKGVKLSAIREEHWGRECFLHDPSGVLWHIGAFKK